MTDWVESISCACIASGEVASNSMNNQELRDNIKFMFAYAKDEGQRYLKLFNGYLQSL